MTSPKQFIISFHISSMVFLSISIFHDHLITKHKLPWITQRKNHMLFRKKNLQFSFQILNKMLIDKLEHFLKKIQHCLYLPLHRILKLTYILRCSLMLTIHYSFSCVLYVRRTRYPQFAWCTSMVSDN